MGKWKCLGLALVLGELLLGASEVRAGGKISIDETKWVSLGAGLRTSFGGVQDGAPNGDNWSTDFNVNNARIYLGGQIHKYLKVEINTECVFCDNADLRDFALLDAIAKVELSPYFNIWAGRILVPAERQEMNGPFYSSTFDAFKTPFFPADFSVKFGDGGAGVYDRDEGLDIWGAFGPEGGLQYVVGVFQGLRSSSNSGPNPDDYPLLATRVAYNFLSVEKNPGYYTSGTYYGTGGNILTLGGAMQYQKDGSGSREHPGDFFGLAGDLLFEMPFTDFGVVTVDGEYKYFDSNYASQAFTDVDPDKFPMFDGNSFSLVGLFMFAPEIGIGKFQPYVRYTGVYPNGSSDRDEFELGLNYIVDGHNARMSLYYQYGDIATKGLNYAPSASGDNVSALHLAIQLQI